MQSAGVLHGVRDAAAVDLQLPRLEQDREEVLIGVGRVHQQPVKHAAVSVHAAASHAPLGVIGADDE